MIDLTHIESLLRVSLFQAGTVKRPLGRTIAEGMEEIELITAGRAHFQLEDYSYPVQLGSMLWHRSGEQTVFDADPLDPYQCLVIAFRVNATPAQRLPRLSAWRNTHALGAFVDEVLSAFHRGDVDRSLLCRYAASTCAWQAHAAGPSRANPTLPSPLRRALNAIAERFAEAIDVAIIAQASGISVPHLHGLFRAHLNTTPNRALEERRLRHARWLLAQEDTSVQHIAEQCGYSGSGHFCRAFKRHQGMSPTQYRQHYSTPE